MAAVASSSSTPAEGTSPGGGAGHRSRFGDTTLTKVFVGGLAWETPSSGLHDHFREYGDILEAVVITDRETGRSKGYGFVTFRDPEAARLAVQEPNPMIGGRRANCNIASMGPSPQQRGRAPRGSHLMDQRPLGPPSYMVGGRMQQMAIPPHAAVYYHPSQYGYWYPPDYPYQQAMYSPQMQHYYPQMYGPTSPSTSHYPYMGQYMPGPSASFSPVQQPAPPSYMGQYMLQQPATAQIHQGSFQTGQTLPPNFRLQAPPHAVAKQSDDASETEQTKAVSATEAASPDNKEATAPVRRSDSSDINTSN